MALVFFHLFETKAGLQINDSKTKTSHDTQGQNLLSGSAPIVTMRDFFSQDGGSAPCPLGKDSGLELAGPQNFPPTDGCLSVAVAFLPALGESGSFAASHRVVFFFHSFFQACGILFPQPGIEPVPSALEAWSVNHWTTNEVPQRVLTALSLHTKEAFLSSRPRRRHLSPYMLQRETRTC